MPNAPLDFTFNRLAPSSRRSPAAPPHPVLGAVESASIPDPYAALEAAAAAAEQPPSSRAIVSAPAAATPSAAADPRAALPPPPPAQHPVLPRGASLASSANSVASLSPFPAPYRTGFEFSFECFDLPAHPLGARPAAYLKVFGLLPAEKRVYLGRTETQPEARAPQFLTKAALPRPRGADLGARVVVRVQDEADDATDSFGSVGSAMFEVGDVLATPRRRLEVPIRERRVPEDGGHADDNTPRYLGGLVVAVDAIPFPKPPARVVVAVDVAPHPEAGAAPRFRVELHRKTAHGVYVLVARSAVVHVGAGVGAPAVGENGAVRVVLPVVPASFVNACDGARVFRVALAREETPAEGAARSIWGIFGGGGGGSAVAGAAVVRHGERFIGFFETCAANLDHTCAGDRLFWQWESLDVDPPPAGHSSAARLSPPELARLQLATGNAALSDTPPASMRAARAVTVTEVHWPRGAEYLAGLLSLRVRVDLARMPAGAVRGAGAVLPREALDSGMPQLRVRAMEQDGMAVDEEP